MFFINGLEASWEDMRFIPGAGYNTSMYLGAILEFLLIVTNVGTAIVLYPIVKRQSEGLAMGYVAARVIESVFILVGLISIVSIVTVTNSLAGATGAAAAALTAQGSLLVSNYEWAFLFGPGLVVGFGNGLVLGYLMYRSGLVPRRMAMLGLVGGPMLPHRSCSSCSGSTRTAPVRLSCWRCRRSPGKCRWASTPPGKGSGPAPSRRQWTGARMRRVEGWLSPNHAVLKTHVTNVIEFEAPIFRSS